MSKREQKDPPDDVISEHEKLLKRLSERPRRSGVGVVLSPDEMEALRALSSLAGPQEAGGTNASPRRGRKTSELEISDEEREVLSDLANGQAAEAHGTRSRAPRRRTTEIQVSSAELELLRRLSYDSEAAGAAAAGVQEQLQAAPKSPKSPVTLKLTASEARWLAREAEAHKKALSDRERRTVEALEGRIIPPASGRGR